MLKLNKRLVEKIKTEELEIDFFRGRFGLEKENVRVSKDGKLSLSSHPETFGNKSENPYITTDFSESQVEVITPPMDSVEEAYNMLETLHNIVSLNIGDELLWPQSTPPILPDEKDIKIAEFGHTDENQEKYRYRKELADKYGRKKQLISGIHYNYSMDDEYIKQLYLASDNKNTFKDFKSNFYLKIMRNTIKYSWFLIKLLGSSPAIHDSYSNYCKNCASSTSIRNGRCGYKNLIDIFVDMNDLSGYVNDIDALVKSGELSSAKEYYSFLRPKNSEGNHDTLLKSGIEYIELRLVDLNPLFKLGISLNDLHLIHLFMLLMSLIDDDEMTKLTFNEAMKNNRKIADDGRAKGSTISLDGSEIEELKVSLEIVDALFEVSTLNKLEKNKYIDVVKDFEERIKNPYMLYSQIIHDDLKEKDFINYHLEKANDYLDSSRAQTFNLIGYEDMELSTQIIILDAIRRGISVDILDRFENFIRFRKDAKTELVKQATKTSKDNYSTVLLMENKAVTKKVLDSAGIRTPFGGIYVDAYKAIEDYKKYKDKQIVVKPNTTNFGIGITIFKSEFTKEDFESALKLAFSHDKTVLIESFVEGKEYRIFVVGDEVVAAMHRVPANVLGDGKKSIRKLVKEKNQSSLRGSGYRKPLQKINLGIEEEMFLSQSHMDFDTIVEKNQTVYLRENSNISTGGDSIDISDDISEHYKEIAIKSAKAVGAGITGVDLITRDISSEKEIDYAIIELNFNPAIHIHCYPYEGKNRHLGDKILDYIGFKDTL